MRAMRAAVAGAVLLAIPMLPAGPARAQQNQSQQNPLLGGIQHFFEGMTPNGSLRQAYQSGRRDEYAALQSARDQACAPQASDRQRYAGGYDPYGGR